MLEKILVVASNNFLNLLELRIGFLLLTNHGKMGQPRGRFDPSCFAGELFKLLLWLNLDAAANSGLEQRSMAKMLAMLPTAVGSIPLLI